MSEIYLRHGEALLSEGDLTQAAEKFWGATATRIKAIAQARGWRHSSHADIGRSLKRIIDESTDTELSGLYKSAETLHANFYENFMKRDDVMNRGNDIKLLIEKLTPFLSSEVESP